MLFLLLSCFSPKISPKPVVPQVRYRPEPSKQSPILDVLPNATWDKGLEKAADELLLQLRSPQARIPHQAIRIALARVGFPAQARFAKVLNQGAFPKELVRELLQDVGKEKVDLALRSCSYADGTTLWLLAWAPHLVEIDPMPQRVPLDGTFSIRMEAKKDQEAMLFISPPDGVVEKSPLLSAVTVVSAWKSLEGLCKQLQRTS